MNKTMLLVLAAVAAVVAFLVWRRSSGTTVAASQQFVGPPVVPLQRPPAMNTQQPVPQPTSGSFLDKLKNAAAAVGGAAVQAGQQYATSYIQQKA